jgi:hypothetical protein
VGSAAEVKRSARFNGAEFARGATHHVVELDAVLEAEVLEPILGCGEAGRTAAG